MNELINFFENTDTKNRVGFSINDYLSWDNITLENKHDFIQWIFPLNEMSNYNAMCPVLDNETIKYFNGSSELTKIHKTCGDKFVSFLQLDQSELPFWWTLNNHNLLRISRMIKSLNLLGNPELADKVYKSAMKFNNFYQMSPLTIYHWNLANSST